MFCALYIVTNAVQVSVRGEDHHDHHHHHHHHDRLRVRNVVMKKIPAKEAMIDTAETVETCRMIGAALCIKMLAARHL